MQKKLAALSGAALAIAATTISFASNDPATPSGASAPSAPSWTDLLAAWGISANGYVATSYYDSNGYPSNIHEFDVHHDTFQLDEAGFAVAYQP